MISQKSLIAGLAASLAVAAGSALAAGNTLPNGESRYGHPVSAPQGVVVVNTATAKSVNVLCGDTVTFVNGAEKFSWRFDSVVHGAVPLSKFAPAAFGSVRTTVYVARNEAEYGG